MSADLRLRTIRRAVAELAVLESELARRLERAQRLSTGHPGALAAVQRYRPMVQRHRDELAAYMTDTGGAGASGEIGGPQAATKENAALSEVLRDLSVAFHHLALGYSMLHEMAARLYEPRLRVIALEHLKAHTDAAFTTARLLPTVVAWQLAQDGLHCTCLCPMCSVGACGCVDWGTEELNAAWRDALPVDAEPPGFMLLPPKPESALARAGVHGGDMILAVDGQQVRGRQEVQDALRKRTFGEEVRLLIRRGSEPSREVIVRHAGDYPKG